MGSMKWLDFYNNDFGRWTPDGHWEWLEGVVKQGWSQKNSTLILYITNLYDLQNKSEIGFSFRASPEYPTATLGNDTNRISLINPMLTITYTPPECIDGPDCGTSGWSGSPFCRGDDVWQDYTNYICNGGGTPSAYCSTETGQYLKQNCSDTCSDGQCVTIACSSNSDCGTDGWVGSASCSNGNVWQDWKTYTCSNPGTASASCGQSSQSRLKQNCPDICSNGQCVNSACNSNSDCGTDGWVGSASCSNGNVWQDWKTYTCSNPGTASASCGQSSQSRLKQNCPDICSNGQCVNTRSCPDSDMDGYADCTVAGCDKSGLNCGDCNDSLKSIFPGAQEVCDGKDNNCNGEIDEGVTNICGNCGPLTAELCDGIDNNCDGQIDEGFNKDADQDTVLDCVDNCPNVDNADQSDIDHDGIGDLCDDDVDGDGVSNVDEGYAGIGTESVDSDGDGIPDYMDESTTHLPADNGTGDMVLNVSKGTLASCITLDETTMPADGKPEDIDFVWGFIEFIITGLNPFESVDVSLIGPETLPNDAQYWKYESQGYYQIPNVTVTGNKITFTLTDDDGDGTILDPGAVGLPVVVSNQPTAPASAPSSSGGGGGGGGGCSLSSSMNSLDLVIFLLPVVWIYRKRSRRP